VGWRGILPLIIVIVVAAPVGAQGVRRPRLDRDADTLDPRSYWAYGNRRDVSWERTYEAYYWSWRLAPDQTDYLYGMYQAMWFRQTPQWRAQFREGVLSVTRSRPARQLDSIQEEIYLRDPFPYLDGPCVWPTGVEDFYQRYPAVAALWFSDYNCHDQAAEYYTRAIDREPGQLWLRLERARSLIFRRQYRAGVEDLRVILDTLRARDETYFSRVYQSKAFFEYMVGVSLHRAQDLRGAREAFGHSLTEDLSFWPAHARLGDVGAAAGNLTEATSEYELAVGLRGDDGVLRYRYGMALMRASRLEDAEAQLREAIRLEPHWMEPYGQLAVCLDRLNRTEDAVAMYRAYAGRVPQRLSSRRDQALARAAELEAGS
jgi:Tfp pilus assembly protein PilF